MKILPTILVVSLIALAGCAMFGSNDDTTLRMHEQISSTLPSKLYREIPVPKTGLKINVDPFPILTERDVNKAEIYPTAGGDAILLRLEPHGSMALDELTTRSRGRYLVTFLNSKPVAAWFMDRRIQNGELLLEGDFTDKEAKKTVEFLNRLSKKRNAAW